MNVKSYTLPLHGQIIMLILPTASALVRLVELLRLLRLTRVAHVIGVRTQQTTCACLCSLNKWLSQTKLHRMGENREPFSCLTSQSLPSH